MFGPLLLAGLVGTVFVDRVIGLPVGVAVLVAVFGTGALHEFYRLCEARDLRPVRAAAMTAFLWLVIAHFTIYGLEVGVLPRTRFLSLVQFTGAADGAVLLLFGLSALLFRRFRSVPDALASWAGFLYVGVLLAFTLRLRLLPKHGEAWILFLVLANKIGDSAAYLVGSRIGRTPLVPSISPKKTVEGLLAALVFGSAAGTAVFALTDAGAAFRGSPALRPLLWVSASLATTGAAALGDLSKSWVKRWAGAKDSGRVIPAFGGFLDMVDSFLFSGPAAMMLYTLCTREWL